MAVLRQPDEAVADAGGCEPGGTGDGGGVRVRDSKDPHGPHLCFTPEAWSAFLTHAALHA
ncbi:DUF397 domain-containing protein [Streptomyces sp. MAR4 CNY-716]